LTENSRLRRGMMLSPSARREFKKLRIQMIDNKFGGERIG
jgi:hypothetical protein